MRSFIQRLPLIICTDTGEVVETYKEYLLTEHWVEFKRRFRSSKYSTRRCVVCGSRHKLALHHLTYMNIGDEELTDVVDLCVDCHYDVHCLVNSMRATLREAHLVLMTYREKGRRIPKPKRLKGVSKHKQKKPQSQ